MPAQGTAELLSYWKRSQLQDLQLLAQVTHGSATSYQSNTARLLHPRQPQNVSQSLQRWRGPKSPAWVDIIPHAHQSLTEHHIGRCAALAWRGHSRKRLLWARWQSSCFVGTIPIYWRVPTLGMRSTAFWPGARPQCHVLLLLLLRWRSFAITFASFATALFGASSIWFSAMLDKASFLSPWTEIPSHIVVSLDVDDGLSYIVYSLSSNCRNSSSSTESDSSVSSSASSL